MRIGDEHTIVPTHVNTAGFTEAVLVIHERSDTALGEGVGVNHQRWLAARAR